MILYALGCLVLLIDQINHDFHHHVLFFCFTLCNHQCEGDEGVISQTFGTIRAIENAIVIKEPQEQRGSNALVAIAERVVLCNQIISVPLKWDDFKY